MTDDDRVRRLMGKVSGVDPIDPALHRIMNTLARAIDDLLNGEARGKDRENGFVLLVLPLKDNPEHRADYISNMPDRREIVHVFKGMIARFEGAGP